MHKGKWGWERIENIPSIHPSICVSGCLPLTRCSAVAWQETSWVSGQVCLLPVWRRGALHDWIGGLSCGSVVVVAVVVVQMWDC